MSIKDFAGSSSLFAHKNTTTPKKKLEDQVEPFSLGQQPLGRGSTLTQGKKDLVLPPRHSNENKDDAFSSSLWLLNKDDPKNLTILLNESNTGNSKLFADTLKKPEEKKDFLSPTKLFAKGPDDTKDFKSLFADPKPEAKSQSSIASFFQNLFKPSTRSYTTADNSRSWSSLVSRTSSSGSSSSSSGQTVAGIDAATINRANTATAGDAVITPPSVESIALLNALNGMPVVDSNGFKIGASEIQRYEALAERLKDLFDNTNGLSAEQAGAEAAKLVSQLVTMDPVYALVMASSLARANYHILAAGIIEKANARDQLRTALLILDGEYEAPAPTLEDRQAAKKEAELLAIKLNKQPAQLNIEPKELSPYEVYSRRPLGLAPLGSDKQEPVNIPLAKATKGMFMQLPLSPQNSGWLSQAYPVQG